MLSQHLVTSCQLSRTGCPTQAGFLSRRPRWCLSGCSASVAWPLCGRVSLRTWQGAHNVWLWSYFLKRIAAGCCTVLNYDVMQCVKIWVRFFWHNHSQINLSTLHSWSLDDVCMFDACKCNMCRACSIWLRHVCERLHHRLFGNWTDLILLFLWQCDGCTLPRMRSVCCDGLLCMIGAKWRWKWKFMKFWKVRYFLGVAFNFMRSDRNTLIKHPAIHCTCHRQIGYE